MLHSTTSDTPYLSAIIPLFNKELTLERAIQSVAQARTELPVEAIIVDDGSTDRSFEIASALAEKHPWIILEQQQNAGAAAARNRACELACSNVLAFLDADDVWLPGHATELLSGFAKSGADFVVTPYSKLVDGEQEDRLLWDVFPNSRIENHFRSMAHGDMYMATSGTAMKSNLFDRIGGFDERLRNGQDRAMWGEAALKSGVYRTSKITAQWHVDTSNSLMSQAHKDKSPKYENWLEEKILELDGMPCPGLEMSGEQLRAAMITNLAEDCMSIGLFAAKNGIEWMQLEREACLRRFGYSAWADYIAQADANTPSYKKMVRGPRPFDSQKTHCLFG